MIISRRLSASIYSVDPTAQSVRSSLSASVRIATRPQAHAPAAMLDVAYLYPNLFAGTAVCPRTAKKAA